MPRWDPFGLCQYQTNKLVRIRSVRLGCLKWSLHGTILLFICLMLLWDRKYQDFDQVVSSVTTKLKGVALVNLTGAGDVVWDEVDSSGPSQGKNSFFVVTNVIVTRNQKMGRCPEIPQKGRVCRSDADCEKGVWDDQSRGVQTGSCVKFDATKKTCQVSAWCPVETKTSPPRPAVLAAAENFTVLIKNNIRFPVFNFIRRNIFPWMGDSYLRSCRRANDSLCPVFRLGDMVREAGQSFADMAVEGGVIGIYIKWDCNLDPLMHHCLPRYSFRRLDERESNRTLYSGLNFRYAKHQQAAGGGGGEEQRTLYKAFGIRFDVLVFGKAGKFSFIQLIIYVGSTLSYFALTYLLMDWLIESSCYSAQPGHSYSDRKVESVQDEQQCILCVSYVDEKKLRLVKASRRRSLQDARTLSFQTREEDSGLLTALLSLALADKSASPLNPGRIPDSPPPPPSWCRCGRCTSPPLPQEALCCRRGGGGACLTTSPLFEQLVLRRPLLEAVLLCQDPLPPDNAVTATDLRHCAYGQYVRWRVGPPPGRAAPALPRCVVDRIRQVYPSADGRYRGFTRPGRRPDSRER